MQWSGLLCEMAMVMVDHSHVECCSGNDKFGD